MIRRAIILIVTAAALSGCSFCSPVLGCRGQGFWCPEPCPCEEEGNIEIDITHYTAEGVEQQICCVENERAKAYSAMRRHEREAERLVAFDKLSYRRHKQEAAYQLAAVYETDAALKRLYGILSAVQRRDSQIGTPAKEE